MNWFKSFTNTPFSDLWLPSILIGLCLIAALGLHWLWLQWRVSRLEAHSKNAILNAAAQADADSTRAMKPPSASQHSKQYGGLSDIQAFTAQKQAVYIEDLNPPAPTMADHTIAPVEHYTTVFAAEPFGDTPSRIDPSFVIPVSAKTNANAVPTNFVNNNLSSAANTRDQATHNPMINRGVDANEPASDIFYNPHVAVLESKSQKRLLVAHEQFHYQARFTWGDTTGKQVLNDVLSAHPWTQSLAVTWLADAHNERSMVAAWQVVNRRELASADHANAFKQWCDTVASLGGAKYELLTTMPWDSFLDEAHSLLIGLDSVIVLKISVPSVQLDLFAQSLLAARFTQSQEHWVYQESSHSASICLERLWQQNGQQAAPAPVAGEMIQNNAMFQLIIDIPHMDSLEARKVYMRLRAVARASAAILQSAQGSHLSEGMLDRYSRELLLKQEALSKADVAPGSLLAKQVFKPHLRMSEDLGF